MSGKIEFKVRAGLSKDPRYQYYPEWYWRIVGEDKAETTLPPRFPQVAQLLHDILVHEFRVDKTRSRRPDFIKKLQLLIMSDEFISKAQTEFEVYNIPDIYWALGKPRIRRVDS